jgi:MraZ protein
VGKSGELINSLIFMFVGQYQHNIDIKGRLAVPAKFRNELKNSIVTKGLDNCLFLYSKKEWEKMAKSVSAYSVNRSNARGYARFILAGAMEVETDKQGRIIIPDYLRKFAGLAKEVIIAGLFDRLEIWDKDKWQAYQSEIEKNSGAIAETLDSAINEVK